MPPPPPRSPAFCGSTSLCAKWKWVWAEAQGLAGGRGASSAFVVRGDLVHRVEFVVDDGVDCHRGSRWQALGAWLRRALGDLGRSACPAHALPRGIPKMEVAEDSLDDFGLIRADGGDDFHGLAAVAADPWVIVPDFADESGPRALSLEEELWLHLSFGVWGTGRR